VISVLLEYNDFSHSFLLICATESLTLLFPKLSFIYLIKFFLLKQNGRIAIEIAAIQGRQQCVEVLFPFTDPLARVADWSIDGVTQHAKLMSSEPQVWAKLADC
jgi:hypothetical protein